MAGKRGHHLQDPATVALSPRKMPGPPHPQTTTTRRRNITAACSITLACALTPACDPHKTTAPPAAVQTADAYPLLADARIDLATSRIAAKAPDEALALLVSALQADPQSTQARAMACEILTNTRWSLPELTLDHHASIDHIEFAAPSSLWVSLSGPANTTVRWNLTSLSIESVLFPLQVPATRTMVFDASHHAAVVERAGVTLLCDAQTLKPIRDLGPLPAFVTPDAAIAFSSDGLLVAHPAYASATDHALVWYLRDAATGDIIRSSEPAAPELPRPLAAFLDHHALRVLRTDANLLELPVSPVKPVQITPTSPTPITLLHAQFAANGKSTLTLKDLGPHLSPESFYLSLGGPADTSLEPAALLARQPWSRHPCLWSWLMGDPKHAAIQINDRTVTSGATGDLAPVHAASAVTAVTASGNQIVVGETNGTLTIYRILPIPLVRPASTPPTLPDDTSLDALSQLTGFLAGVHHDPTRRAFIRASTPQRLQAFQNCNFTALQCLFPTLDFSPLVAAIHAFNPRAPAPDTLCPLTERLAQATPNNPAARLAIQQVFESDDDAAITTAIRTAGGKGAAAATALELALASTHPAWIDACLTQAVDLPPLLRRLATSRIAWLQDRKADALTGWPDVFPDLQNVKLREDWNGWEQADFNQALEKLRLCMTEELAAIHVPPNPTPAQRQAVAARLNDPATLKAVGRDRFSMACLQAALALASFKDEKEATFTLAARARELGAPPAPCLRAEAIALTEVGDYQHAHASWIALITDNPPDTHQPGDYAEAAYTAFENANPRQAMAILTTGLHRYPNDANFALRAGWVALLTGNSERAYRFLLTGRQIGYPPEKLENATALLAIAAAQSGASEDADAFYQDLIRLDTDWRNPATIDSLEWPEDLKSSLRQLVR